LQGWSIRRFDRRWERASARARQLSAITGTLSGLPRNPQSEAGDGQVFADIRGRGRLLVGALENSDGQTVGSYMSVIRQESYAEYKVDYAPRGATWFVLSGQNDRDVFYEKVIFSCSGRIINSFALIYPIESKREFDPIVEGIEKTFRPGR
jgi:hypothetical protein